jgi:UDP-N-acetyl-D-glucosamine dehydrogenase
LIVLESTTYPGTTRDLMLPALEQSGLKVGQDFFLAFSPERVDPGNPKYGTRNTPKVVGGITAACTDIACRVYAPAIERLVTREGMMVIGSEYDLESGRVEFIG